jgi:ABC-2 type transport system permease protein
MSAPSVPADRRAPREAADAEALSIPRRGWLVIARKELADYVLSPRFAIMLLVLGAVAIAPLYFITDALRNVPAANADVPALFLALFTAPVEEPQRIPSVTALVAIVAPLLGIAFSFDAVNSERSDGTLPRLLSQPIHRDDVINGKFAAGLVAIFLVLVTVLVIIAAVGIFRIGVVPQAAEIVRLVAWTLLTTVYVAFWLALGLLLSVLVRRAATAALIAFALFFFFTIFGAQLVVDAIAGLVSPISGATQEELYSAAWLQRLLNGLLPNSLYGVAALALLSPAANAASVNPPGSLAEYLQGQEQVPTLLSLEQSVLLVWPYVVALVALTVICFALAYIAFMRQEVRA